MSWRATAAVKPITHDAFGRKLTSTEKLVLLILSDYYSEEKLCAWAGTARLATESLLSIRQLLRILKSLEGRELISLIRREGQTNLYKFKFLPVLERCWYCGASLCQDNRQQDHQTPKSRGGGGGKNLVLACRTCNEEKSDETLEEYRLSHFDVGHKFYGETRDNLSQAKSVNVTPLVTPVSVPPVTPMSPKPIFEPTRADIQPLTEADFIPMSDEARRELLLRLEREGQERHNAVWSKRP